MKIQSSFAAQFAVVAAGASIVSSSARAAEIDPALIERLQKQVQALTEEVERLKEGPMKTEASPVADTFFKGNGLKLGFYGEAKYRFPQSGANAFDPHRFVLTPSYAINDWLVFNSELEFEHGGVDETSGTTGNGTQRSRFDGEIELEQFYVDILLKPHFNIRSLGIDLVPVGRINKYHEPTTFYSTERPELYREIIPSTWFEPSAGIFGKVVDGLNYQLMVSSGLEDAISGSTAAGINASGGMRGARPRVRRADENNLAYSGRLHFNGMQGLDASSSFYVTRVTGSGGRSSTVALFDVEAAYRVPKTGLELRGDFAYWHIDAPGNLLANNNGSATDDVGDRMYGWYLEAAYHFWPEAFKKGIASEMDLVPFIRFSQIVTQDDLSSGTELDNGTTNKDFLTAGVAWLLNPNFVIKADYRRNLDGTAATERSEVNQDYFQLGAGVFF
ncbi:MAG: hypothetical protein IPK15_25110 [Verrucomicrobia bacterium]|nr:hypothetical protein [Verrucomicrobiota bacterium]